MISGVVAAVVVDVFVDLAVDKIVTVAARVRTDNFGQSDAFAESNLENVTEQKCDMCVSERRFVNHNTVYKLCIVTNIIILLTLSLFP